jgi:two-component system sensor histidine kinase/response regulator
VKRFRRTVWVWTATLLVFFLTAAEARSPETGKGRSLDSVTLQLKWTHQFQFAGYYAALEKGYYRDAGLDVTIVPAKPDSEPMQEVLDGKAEFGVGTTDVVLLRDQGKPVVVLAVIFQHSPLVLIARKNAGIESIHDLKGKRVMIEPHSAELLAYF